MGILVEYRQLYVDVSMTSLPLRLSFDRLLYLTGPDDDPGTIGICVEECTNDGDCENDMKCCSNGCGHSCQQPGKNRSDVYSGALKGPNMY